jgi:large subunit ribosomal protein L21e
MAKRMGGNRRKTRSLLKKSKKNKGKISLRKYFQSFKQGDKVQLVMEPAVHEGMFYPCYYGKVGTVMKMRGRCYEVEIYDGSVSKIIITHPIHLKRIQ